jgi:hypothetical protein
MNPEPITSTVVELETGEYLKSSSALKEIAVRLVPFCPRLRPRVTSIRYVVRLGALMEDL